MTAQAVAVSEGRPRVRLGRSAHAPLAGLRRRGYTPESLRTFVERAGVAKVASIVDIQLLEHCLRKS